MSLVQIRKQHRANNGDYFGDLIIDTEAIAYIEGPTKNIQGKSYGCVYLKNGERIRIQQKEYAALKLSINYVDNTSKAEQEEAETSETSQSPIARF